MQLLYPFVGLDWHSMSRSGPISVLSTVGRVTPSKVSAAQSVKQTEESCNAL